jgi:hypothetical protein
MHGEWGASRFPLRDSDETRGPLKPEPADFIYKAGDQAPDFRAGREGDDA